MTTGRDWDSCGKWVESELSRAESELSSGVAKGKSNKPISFSVETEGFSIEFETDCGAERVFAKNGTMSSNMSPDDSSEFVPIWSSISDKGVLFVYGERDRHGGKRMFLSLSCGFDGKLERVSVKGRSPRV